MSKPSKAELELQLDAALEELADAKDRLENLTEAHLAGSHVAISSETFGDVTIGLDAAGNAVEVTFAGNGWEGE